MFVCCECCGLYRYRSLRRADHSYRRVLQPVVRRCVWSRNIGNEEALDHWGLLRQKQNFVSEKPIRTYQSFIEPEGLLRDSTTSTCFLCVLDRASSWYLNKGWPTRWHLLYNILLNMFQTLIRPSSGASEYMCCVGWLEACWCYVAGLSVGDVVSECRLNHYSE